MCVPSPQTAPAPAPDYPSMQTASDLNLAGQPRGAAQLGRLALRMVGNPSATAVIAPVPPVTPTAQTPSTQAAPSGQTTAAGTYVNAGPGVQPGSAGYTPQISLRMQPGIGTRA